MRIIHSWLTIFFALLIAGGGSALPIATIRAQSLQPGTIDAAQQILESAPANSTPENSDYSQEPYVFERFSTRAAFQKDGNSRADLEVVVHVLSETGVQRFGQLVFGYNSSNQKLDVISVEIRKAGNSSFTSASAVRDSAPLASGGAPAYSDYREKHITVPGLRPGDTLAYHISRTTTIPLVPDQFWFEHDFVKDAIVLDEQLEISVPGNSAVKLKNEPGVDPMMSDEAERRVYRWNRSRVKREVDAPRKYSTGAESQIPPVQLTTFKNWEDLGRCYLPLLLERAALDASVRAKAEELTHGRGTDAEKIEALYDFVATKVRTINLPFSFASDQPHAASETLANQYGDAKDKHTLLAALLEAAGIRAFPALISSGRDLDPDFASLAEINHLITAIPPGTTGNDWLWLDTSTEVAPFRMLAPSLRGKHALIIPISAPGTEPKPGAPLLVRTPADPPSIQVRNIDITGRLNDQGKLTAHIHYSITGDNALALRMAFRRTPEADWKQLGQILAVGDGFTGEISAVKSSDPSDTHKPFEVDYEISQANFADLSRNIPQLRLPLPALGIPDAQEPSDGAMKPLQLGSPVEIQVRATIELPAGYAARAPIPVKMTRDFASYRSNYSIKGNIVEAQRNIVVRQREIPEGLMPDYSAFVRAARADEAQLVSIEVLPAPATPAETKTNSSK